MSQKSQKCRFYMLSFNQVIYAIATRRLDENIRNGKMSHSFIEAFH